VDFFCGAGGFSQGAAAVPGVTVRTGTGRSSPRGELERDGLLIRTVHPVVRPKVEYTLTEMAQELYKSLLELPDWAKRELTTAAA
jgi:hypothetical protein